MVWLPGLQVCVYVCMHACMYMYIMYVCMYACMYMYVHVYGMLFATKNTMWELVKILLTTEKLVHRNVLEHVHENVHTNVYVNVHKNELTIHLFMPLWACLKMDAVLYDFCEAVIDFTENWLAIVNADFDQVEALRFALMNSVTGIELFQFINKCTQLGSPWIDIGR